MCLRHGRWTVPDPLRARRTLWLGQLVAEGLMIRTVRVSQLECSELLRPVDVTRRSDGDDGVAPLQSGATWRVVQDARVALPDGMFTRMPCQWPAVLELIQDLFSRLTHLRRPTVSVTLKRLRETKRLISLSRSCWPLPGPRPSEDHSDLRLPLAA
jgi:hypothetical protein